VTVHLVCHDCELEGLIADEDEADRLAKAHRHHYGHRVETLTVEDLRDDEPVSGNARNAGGHDA
jgi:hypothetical protein